MTVETENRELADGALQIIYVTTPNQEAALKIAKAVVTDKLAACANIIGGMTAVYEWEGALHEDAETVLILKTRRELVAPLTKRVKALHSYDCPCVVALDIVEGNADYLEWMLRQTK